MKIAKRFRRKGGFVVSTIDHQWESTLKQWIGVITSRWFLKPSIDSFLVAGDRQAYFAKKLGYDSVFYGLYSAEVDEFKTVKPLRDRNPSFLFIGRLSAEKGVKELIDAYLMYRQQCPFPWDLRIAGTGKLKSLLNDIPGVKAYGFVQPADLPKLMQNAKTFILPSKWEPWGVVIHEAAAAGLPIICTYQCGAVTAYVRDGINGFIVRPCANDLKDAMLKMTSCGPERLERFGNASRALGLLWTPRELAVYLIENLKSKITLSCDSS
jgi:glycosyltransferase involved in cell wall biosynthesis